METKSNCENNTLNKEVKSKMKQTKHQKCLQMIQSKGVIQQENKGEENQQDKEVAEHQEQQQVSTTLSLKNDQSLYLDCIEQQSSPTQSFESKQFYDARTREDSEVSQQVTGSMDPSIKQSNTDEFLTASYRSTPNAKQGNEILIKEDINDDLNLNISPVQRSPNQESAKQKNQFKSSNLTGNETKEIEDIILQIDRAVRNNGKLPKEIQTNIHKIGNVLAHQGKQKRSTQSQDRIKDVQVNVSNISSLNTIGSTQKEKSFNNFNILANTEELNSLLQKINAPLIAKFKSQKNLDQNVESIAVSLVLIVQSFDVKMYEFIYKKQLNFNLFHQCCPQPGNFAVQMKKIPEAIEIGLIVKNILDKIQVQLDKIKNPQEMQLTDSISFQLYRVVKITFDLANYKINQNQKNQKNPNISNQSEKVSESTNTTKKRRGLSVQSNMEQNVELVKYSTQEQKASTMRLYSNQNQQKKKENQDADQQIIHELKFNIEKSKKKLMELQRVEQLKEAKFKREVKDIQKREEKKKQEDEFSKWPLENKF